ncbi:Subtilisin-like serine endopeptidase family protein [Raphanus sativus]|nr:Subtilisin-like serine endopeptidase family protein [Raphanus sativus]
MAIALHAFFLQLILFFFASLAEANNPRKIYLVQMKVGGHRYGSSSGHKELLGEVLDDNSTVANALIYSYSESFTGFSASLTQNERQKLKRRREVLQVSRSRNLKLHTTRSWDFMNLTLAAKRNPLAESDLVVAVIDSGIWPYSELFSSDSPPPLAWQNKCENITCNNKIVGARSYYLEKEHYNVTEEKSVIDVTGHGTHVASIVAGKEIEKASYFGLAEGTMRGGVPNAKIAVYKTCWKILKEGKEVSYCPEHKALEAIEDAIKDKVDIISYSQGLPKPIPIHKDCVSWAFLRALEKGILTSTVAGNSGMNPYAIINGAPWVMTVAASLKDRFFMTELELEEEDDSIFVYNTINTFQTQDSFYPLLDETSPDESTRKRALVAESKDSAITLNHRNGTTKDVFFNFSQTILDKAIEERVQGAVVWGNFSENYALGKLQFPIASIFLDKEKGSDLREDLAKPESKHSVKIHKTVEIPPEEGLEPTVADMSSRGPNCDRFLENILKPDLAAPGVDIIAGWPENVNLLPTGTNDYRHLRFNILSGTSMACPHATGLALYLKSFYPSWSPSAIKSALMTTSSNIANSLCSHGNGTVGQ